MPNDQRRLEARRYLPPCLRRVRALKTPAIRVPCGRQSRDLVTAPRVPGKPHVRGKRSSVSKTVESWPKCECHTLWEVTILKVVAADWDTYNRFLTTELTSAPNVSHVKSALAIRTSKFAFGIPIPVDEE